MFVFVLLLLVTTMRQPNVRTRVVHRINFIENKETHGGSVNNVRGFQCSADWDIQSRNTSTIASFIPTDSIRPDPVLYTQFIYFLRGLFLW